MRKALSSLLFTIFVVLGLIGSAPGETLKAGYISKDLNYLPYFASLKKGFYAKEGLQVDLVSIGRADVQLQALVAGELHFSGINTDGVIIWDEKGGNLKAVAGSSNAAPYVLIGAKNIKKIDDLKGGKLGVAGLTGGATSILLTYLRSKGLVYPRDFTMVVVTGGTPARLSALESGAIAGAVLGVPFADMAIDRGFTRLGETVEVISAYEFNAIHVSTNWAEKNRSSVVGFIKAHIQSLRWIYEHPDQAADFLIKEFGMKAPYARRGIDYYTKNKVYAVDGAVTLEGLKVNIEVQARDGFIKGPLPPPEKYTDLSYLREAQKELGIR